MNVYFILLTEDTNYGTCLYMSRLYSSSKWGHALLISGIELGNSVIFLFLRNRATCFILLIFLLSLMSSVSTYKPPPICIKGLMFTSLPSDIRNHMLLLQFQQLKKTEYMHPTVAVLYINYIKCYKCKFVLRIWFYRACVCILSYLPKP